ncbi:MAG: hypothetical protein WCQ00_03400 [bacterium]
MTTESTLKSMVKPFTAPDAEWQIIGSEDCGDELEKELGLDINKATITIEIIEGKFGIWFLLWESWIDINIQNSSGKKLPTTYTYRIKAATKRPVFTEHGMNLGNILFQIVWDSTAENCLKMITADFAIYEPHLRDTNLSQYVLEAFESIMKTNSEVR